MRVAVARASPLSDAIAVVPAASLADLAAIPGPGESAFAWQLTPYAPIAFGTALIAVATWRSRRGRHLTPSTVLLLSLPAALAAVLPWTSGSSDLFWSSASLVTEPTGPARRASAVRDEAVTLAAAR